MRLIDADAFKKVLGTDTKIRETFCKIIDSQPTAYDIDAVVTQLEVLHDLVRNDQKLVASQAIDIVKKTR